MCVAPTITMSSNVTICSGQSTTISVTVTSGTSPFTYVWAPSGSLSSPTISNPVASPTATTVYTVTVTDAQPCTSTGTMMVTVNPTPTVTVGGTGSICPGSSATLTASGGNTYSWWNNGSTTTSITVSPTVNTTYTLTGTDANGCTGTGTGTVSLYPAPTPSISGTFAICGGDPVTLTGSGGVTYSWAPGGQTTTSIVVVPTVTSSYTLTATDGNGCTGVTSATITVNGAPTITVSGSTTVCNGASATLTASGGDTYGWSTGQTTSSIVVNPSTTTTYTVTGTITSTGCSGQATGTVSLYPSPTASISGNLTICSGQSTTLTGSGGINYSWSTGSTSNPISVNPTISTSYTVVATDANGCTDDSSVTVAVNPLPTANAGPDVSICSGSSTTLNGTGNGSFAWAPSGSLSCSTCVNPVANPTSTTTYTLTVTNSCGSATSTVTITINSNPSVNAGTDVTICLGGNTTLTASGSGTFQWSPSTGLSNTSIANPVANPTVSTNYTVTMTDICGTASDSVWVYIGTPTASITGNSPICSGSSTTLTANAGTGYAWSPGGQSTSSIVVSPTTTSSYTVIVTDAGGCTATASMTVSVNALPSASISGNTTVCSGVNSTLTASGGTSYSWNTSATTTSIVVNITSATNYTVTVTDANGCTNTASVSLSVSPQPTAFAGADTAICVGGSAVLNAAGNGTYSWSTGQTTASITVSPTSSTTYTLFVTNSCGTATDSVTIFVQPLPVVTVSGVSTICLGTPDTIAATGGGNYLWSPGGQTTSSIIVNPTSNTGYTVTVTSGAGCSNTGTFSVSVSSVAASIAGNSTICSGQVATLSASGGTSYSWSTGQTGTLISVSPSVTTGYTVTASNSIGCTGTAVFTISVTPTPTVSVSASSTTFCSGSATTLNASGGTTYLWAPSTGLSNTTIANPTANPTTSITYTVLAFNGTCADTATIPLTVNPNPTITITALPQTNICNGSCATITASGGVSYVWNPGGQTTASVTECPTLSTTYSVTATGANGCTSSGTTLITVLPQINLIVNGITNICAGNSTTLTAQNGGTTYSWLPNGQTSATIIVMPSVTTSYTVTSSNGACSDTAGITVNVSPIPTVTVSASPNTINIGASTTLSGNTSTGTYIWSPTTGLSCAACPNPVASPVDTTVYVLCTTDANGCSACDSVIVYVTKECGDIFVPNAFSPNGDSHNDWLCVRAPGSNGGGECKASPCIKEISFTIYNRWGQKVFFSDDAAVGWDGTIQGKPADAAVFFFLLDVTLIDETFFHKEGSVSLVR